MKVCFMHKRNKAIIFLLLFNCSLSFAQDFRALYSCSSGGEDKPIAYAFNSKYMLRDGASESPFELVANYKDGELMYSGFVRGENFKFWDETFGFTDGSMKKWAAQFNLINPIDPVDTKQEYILRKALSCTLDANAGVRQRNDYNLNYKRIKGEDKSNVDFSYADSCERSKEFASTLGIKDIVEFFRGVNFKKLARQEGAVRKSLVVINTKKGEIWESLVGSKASPKIYKCSVIPVNVPPISPPKEKMFSDSI